MDMLDNFTRIYSIGMHIDILLLKLMDNWPNNILWLWKWYVMSKTEWKNTLILSRLNECGVFSGYMYDKSQIDNAPKDM